jgi:hypothetical protein
MLAVISTIPILDDTPKNSYDAFHQKSISLSLSLSQPFSFLSTESINRFSIEHKIPHRFQLQTAIPPAPILLRLKQAANRKYLPHAADIIVAQHTPFFFFLLLLLLL